MSRLDDEMRRREALKRVALKVLREAGLQPEIKRVGEDAAVCFDTLTLTVDGKQVRIRSQDSEDYSSWLEFEVSEASEASANVISTEGTGG